MFLLSVAVKEAEVTEFSRFIRVRGGGQTVVKRVSPDELMPRFEWK